MDFANVEKSRSKIPRAIKPPSRLPVPIATKENKSRKNPAEGKAKSTVIENASIKLGPEIKLPTTASASTKAHVSSRHARLVGKTASTKTIANDASHTVNKKATNSELCLRNKKFTKATNQITNIKTFSKETVNWNKRLTNVAFSDKVDIPTSSCNANKRLTISARNTNKGAVTENKRLKDFAFKDKIEKPAHGKVSDSNGRFTSIANKGPVRKPTFIERNAINRGLSNVDEIKTKKQGNLEIQLKMRDNHLMQPEIEQSNTKYTQIEEIQEELVTEIVKIEPKSKIDILFDKNSDQPPNIEDLPQPPSLDNEDKNHFSQPEIEFVADERYRNQILFGKGFSPNLKQEQFKISLASERPSFFLQSKTALRALEKLEEEGRRVSIMKMNGLLPTSAVRSSQPTKNDAYQTVLKALENINLAAEDRRVSTLKKSPSQFRSPCMSPFHKPSINPVKTALKQIEALQLKRKAESTKKVTFSLKSSDLPCNIQKPDDNLRNNDFEIRITDVSNEEGRNIQCFTPKLEKTISSETSATDKSTKPQLHSILRVRGQNRSPNGTGLRAGHSEKIRRSESTPHPKFSAPENKEFHFKQPLQPQNAVEKSLHSAISESVGPCLKTQNRFVSSVLTFEEHRNSLYASQSRATADADSRRNTLSKLCTPKPILLFPNASRVASISPEFLCRRTSQIVSHAPISTPMVLRTLAQNLEDGSSPLAREQSYQVCQRLDFDGIAGEAAGDASRSPQNNQDCSSKLFKTNSISLEVNPPEVSVEKKEDNQCSTSKIEQNKSASDLQSSTNSTSLNDNVKREPTTSHFNAMLIRICGQTNISSGTNSQVQLPTKNNQQIESLCSKNQTSTETLKGFSTTTNNLLSKSLLLPQTFVEKHTHLSHTADPYSINPKRLGSVLVSAEHRNSLYSSRSQTTETLKGFSTTNNKNPPSKSLLLPQTSVEKHTHLSHTADPYSINPKQLGSVPVSAEHRNSLYLSQTTLDPGSRRDTLSKLCTPRPISFFPKTSVVDCLSPEFVCRRMSQIVAPAPISTPMVMRTLAKNLDDSMSPVFQYPRSPVCRWLDFGEMEEEAADEPVRASRSPFQIQKLPIQGIRTSQQILDRLADEECRLILSNTSFPVISQRSFWNPVAHILTHGDDMHFVPLKLE